jgi:competence protein ComEA
MMLVHTEMSPQALPLLTSASTAPAARIWLNLASTEELMTLPGIGPVLAERIVRYRLVHGPFHTLAELKNVQGIGPQTLEKIRERVRLDCPPASC